jgi:hypothetical protein
MSGRKKSTNRSTCILYKGEFGGNRDFLLSPSGRVAFKKPQAPVMSKDPKPSGSDSSEILPKLSKTQQEATEHDFWDLDDDEIAPEPKVPTSKSNSLPAKKVSKSSINSKGPIERQIEIPLLTQPQDSPDGEEDTEASEKPVAKKKTGKKTLGKKIAAKKIAPKKEEKHELGDFEDLDDIPEIKDSDTPEPKELKTDLPRDESMLPEVEANGSEEKKEVPEQSDNTEEPEGEENGEPNSISISSFSKIEKISLLSLAAILLIAGILSIVHFTNRVPTRSIIAEEIDFPVEGKSVTINSARTHWREPVRGEDGDVVRRGTKLIPVLDVSLETKKSAAIRIFFRNNEGEVIGDGITRDVSGKTKISIPATAGFDDIGMHAAYRTGESPSWTVQVYEGPNANASREQFKKVMEMEISTDRR